MQTQAREGKSIRVSERRRRRAVVFSDPQKQINPEWDQERVLSANEIDHARTDANKWLLTERRARWAKTKNQNKNP